MKLNEKKKLTSKGKKQLTEHKEFDKTSVW